MTRCSHGLPRGLCVVPSCPNWDGEAAPKLDRRERPPSPEHLRQVSRRRRIAARLAELKAANRSRASGMIRA